MVAEATSQSEEIQSSFIILAKEKDEGTFLELGPPLLTINF